MSGWPRRMANAPLFCCVQYRPLVVAPNAVDLKILVSDELPHHVGIIVVDCLSHLVKQSLVPFLAAKESCQFDKCFSAPNNPDTK